MSILSKCPRGRDDCEPLANMVAEEPSDHICMGLNKKRNWPSDVYRFCMANPSAPHGGGPDVCFDADYRDLIDQVSVITRGLSAVANGEHDTKEAGK